MREPLGVRPQGIARGEASRCSPTPTACCSWPERQARALHQVSGVSTTRIACAPLASSNDSRYLLVRASGWGSDLRWPTPTTERDVTGPQHWQPIRADSSVRSFTRSVRSLSEVRDLCTEVGETGPPYDQALRLFLATGRSVDEPEFSLWVG